MKDLTPNKTNKSPTFESIKQKYTQKLPNTSRSPSRNYISGTVNQEVYSARSVAQPLNIINSNVSPFKLKETRENYKDYKSGGKLEFDLNSIRQRINQNSENIVKAECLTDRIHSQRAFNKVSIEQTKRSLLRQHLQTDNFYSKQNRAKVTLLAPPSQNDSKQFSPMKSYLLEKQLDSEKYLTAEKSQYEQKHSQRVSKNKLQKEMTHKVISDVENILKNIKKSLQASSKRA